MAFNVLIIDGSAVMRAMIIKPLNMSELPLGEVRGVVLISTESSSTRIAALREKGAVGSATDVFVLDAPQVLLLELPSADAPTTEARIALEQGRRTSCCS